LLPTYIQDVTAQILLSTEKKSEESGQLIKQEPGIKEIIS
jgi:hypothetical protein